MVVQVQDQPHGDHLGSSKRGRNSFKNPISSMKKLLHHDSHKHGKSNKKLTKTKSQGKHDNHDPLRIINTDGLDGVDGLDGTPLNASSETTSTTISAGSDGTDSSSENIVERFTDSFIESMAEALHKNSSLSRISSKRLSRVDEIPKKGRNSVQDDLDDVCSVDSFGNDGNEEEDNLDLSDFEHMIMGQSLENVNLVNNDGDEIYRSLSQENKAARDETRAQIEKDLPKVQEEASDCGESRQSEEHVHFAKEENNDAAPSSPNSQKPSVFARGRNALSSIGNITRFRSKSRSGRSITRRFRSKSRAKNEGNGDSSSGNAQEADQGNKENKDTSDSSSSKFKKRSRSFGRRSKSLRRDRDKGDKGKDGSKSGKPRRSVSFDPRLQRVIQDQQLQRQEESPEPERSVSPEVAVESRREASRYIQRGTGGTGTTDRMDKGKKIQSRGAMFADPALYEQQQEEQQQRRAKSCDPPGRTSFEGNSSSGKRVTIEEKSLSSPSVMKKEKEPQQKEQKPKPRAVSLDPVSSGRRKSNGAADDREQPSTIDTDKSLKSQRCASTTSPSPTAPNSPDSRSAKKRSSSVRKHKEKSGKEKGKKNRRATTGRRASTERKSRDEEVQELLQYLERVKKQSQLIKEQSEKSLICTEDHVDSTVPTSEISVPCSNDSSLQSDVSPEKGKDKVKSQEQCEPTSSKDNAPALCKEESQQSIQSKSVTSSEIEGDIDWEAYIVPRRSTSMYVESNDTQHTKRRERKSRSLPRKPLNTTYSSSRGTRQSNKVNNLDSSLLDIHEPNRQRACSVPRKTRSFVECNSQKKVPDLKKSSSFICSSSMASSNKVTARGSNNYSPLPRGWVKLIDPGSGNPYYANLETNESSWERPGSSVSGINNCEEPINDDESLSLSSIFSDKSAQNKSNNTKKSSVIHSSSLSPENDKHRDGSSKMSSIGEESQDDGQQAETQAKIEDESLPSGWIMLTDPKSGNPYYANTETNETSWERPTPTARTISGADSTKAATDDQSVSPSTIFAERCVICFKTLEKDQFVTFCNFHFCDDKTGNGSCFKCHQCNCPMNRFVHDENNDVLVEAQVILNGKGTAVQCGRCTKQLSGSLRSRRSW